MSNQNSGQSGSGLSTIDIIEDSDLMSQLGSSAALVGLDTAYASTISTAAEYGSGLENSEVSKQTDKFFESVKKGFSKDNLTGDLKQSVKKQKVSLFLFVGSVILFLLSLVYYLVIDFGKTKIANMSANFTRLLLLWISVWLVVFLINFIMNDVSLGIGIFTRIFFIASLCFWFIAGSTYLTISVLPGLVEIFENTVGYYYISYFPFRMVGQKSLHDMMSLFKSKHYPSFDLPYDVLITKYDINNFNELYNSIRKQQPKYVNPIKGGGVAEDKSPAIDPISLDFYIQLNNGEGELAVKENLYRLVKTKNNVGHMTWMYLSSTASMIVALIAMNNNLLQYMK